MRADCRAAAHSRSHRRGLITRRQRTSEQRFSQRLRDSWQERYARQGGQRSRPKTGMAFVPVASLSASNVSVACISIQARIWSTAGITIKIATRRPSLPPSLAPARRRHPAQSPENADLERPKTSCRSTHRRQQSSARLAVQQASGFTFSAQTFRSRGRPLT